MEWLNEILEEIEPLNKAIMNQKSNQIDNLTKPIGSLGVLEKIAIQIAGIKNELNSKINRKNIIIMCSDNGVVESGVSSNPQEVTKIVTENFTKNITGINALASFAKSDIKIIDIGVKFDFNHSMIVNKKIAYGTQNMLYGSAMSRVDALEAIKVGIEIVDQLSLEGYDLLGTGEMGVGNTATSGAVFSVLSGREIEVVVGKGAGLTEEQLIYKKQIVERSIQINQPNAEDVIDVLAKVGGFDIAGLCGCFIGAAKNKIPIVIDGLIASVAALCAYKLNPIVKEYMIPSHLSKEPASKYVMNELGLNPMLNLDMRLGEGTGCPLAFNIIEASLYAVSNMGTFSDAKLNKKDYVDIR